MENILQIHLQEIIFGSPEPKISKQISKLQKEGKIRKIAPLQNKDLLRAEVLKSAGKNSQLEKYLNADW
jgi:hypothetical protein